MKIIFLFFLITLFFHSFSQVSLDPISLISTDKTQSSLCFNNAESIKGKTSSEHYATHFNSDTVFLDVYQTGVWTKKMAYRGSNISLACIAYQRDTTWLCWAETNKVKAIYTPNKGVTWSTVFNVSPTQLVGGPSMYASDNGKIHFTWFVYTAADTTVKHNVFANGSFLAAPNTISSPGFKSTWSSITAKGDSVYCVWKEYHGSKYSIYYSRSFTGGTSGSWLVSPILTSTVAFGGKDPSISYSYNSTLSQHILHVAFDSNNKIWYQQSTDLGNTWTTPSLISNVSKYSQFARITSNNTGFVGVAYEHRRVFNLFNDKTKDVGFVYSANWGSTFSSNDSTSYINSPFGSILGLINKISENTFYLSWLTHDTVQNNYKYYERNINLGIVGLNSFHDKTEYIQMYPNPIENDLNIKSNSNVVEIKIVDMKGIEWKKWEGQSKEIKLNLQDLPNGFYIANMKDNYANIKMSKIIINK